MQNSLTLKHFGVTPPNAVQNQFKIQGIGAYYHSVHYPLPSLLSQNTKI